MIEHAYLAELLQQIGDLCRLEERKSAEEDREQYQTFIIQTTRTGDYHFGLTVYFDGDVRLFAELTSNEKYDFWYVMYELADYDGYSELASSVYSDLRCVVHHDTTIVKRSRVFTVMFECLFSDNGRWITLKSNSYFRFGNFNFPAKDAYTLSEGQIS